MNMQQTQTVTPDSKSHKSKKKGLRRIFGFGARHRKKHGSVDIDGDSFFDTATAPVTTQPLRSQHAQQQQAWMMKQTSGSRGQVAVARGGGGGGGGGKQQQGAVKRQQRQQPLQQQSQTTTQKSSKSSKSSWLAKTKFFQNMISNAFEAIDADGSNDIDEKELYSGLLLIHLQLGAYAGPAACKPISREKCHSVFIKMDVDGSGRLDKDEFGQVMMVLFGNVMLRVVFQYAATLAVVPILAQYLLTGITWLIYELIPFVWIHYIDEHTSIDEYFNDTLFVLLQTKIIEVTKQPETFLQIRNFLQDLFDKIPDSVWSTIPLTLISTILSMMIVPWTLMKIDDFFQYVAGGGNSSESNKKKKKS